MRTLSCVIVYLFELGVCVLFFFFVNFHMIWLCLCMRDSFCSILFFSWYYKVRIWILDYELWASVAQTTTVDMEKYCKKNPTKQNRMNEWMKERTNETRRKKCMAKRIKCVGMHIKHMKLRLTLTKENDGHNSRAILRSSLLFVASFFFYAFIGIEIQD